MRVQIPTGVGDANATEMVRFWLAHDRPHLTLLLGMYEDAKDCEVDELFAWETFSAILPNMLPTALRRATAGILPNRCGSS